MSTRTPTVRTLLRASSNALRHTQNQPSSQLTSRTFTQLQPRLRSRSPSPPADSLRPSTAQWTRFSTPYSLSSIRTFTSSNRLSLPPPSSSQASSPEAAQKIEEAMEQIQDLYGTARDEFEMASEETEKNTTYAEEDRAAAREELDKLLEYYGGILEGGDRAVAEEVKRRVGQRIRELEQAVLALEESVTHGD